MQLIEKYSKQNILDLREVKSILRDKYVSIVENGKVIFFVIDKAGIIRYASQSVKEILDFKPSKLLGRKLAGFIEPSSKSVFDESVRQVNDDPNETVNFKDLSLFSTDCKRHYFDGLIVHSEIFSGTHFVIYLHDVTDRKVNEEALTQTNLELDGFIYKASHDLRAPLASLSGLINLAEKSTSLENRVDGLTGFFTGEVRLSHHIAYGSRTTRFVEHTVIALYTDHSFDLL
jgi:PAS domain S-box-containing protein